MIEHLEPFAAALIVGLWGALCLLAAQREFAPARWLPALGLGLGLAAALVGLTGPDLVGVIQAGVAVDRLAALLDALIVAVMLAAVVADPHGPEDGQAGWRRGLLMIAGAGAMLTVRAGDWATLIVGIELATLAGGLCLAAEPADPALDVGEAPARKTARTWLLGQGVGAAILWLGVGLVVAGTGTLKLHELGSRVGAAFLRWGAHTAQAAVDVLNSRQELPVGLIAHARDAAVEGMAPAALYVPGALLVLAGLLVRAGVFPLLAGRIAAAGRAGLCGWVATELVVRTAAVAALIRVFVMALHAPRVVYGPYGWGTAAAVIGGLSVVGCGIGALRAADLRRLLAWAGAAQVGLTVLALAAAANFVAHAGLRTGGLELAEHYAWGQAAAEAAVAAALAGHVIFALAACGALAAAAAVDRGRGPFDLAGLAGRSPALAGALVVCALALAGAPPTGGFAGRWWLFTAVLEDSNVLIRAVAAAAALGSALVAWACLRPLAAALTPRPGATPRRARRGGLIVAAVLSGMLVGTGVYAQGLWSLVEAAAAGVGLPIGGKSRRDWLSRSER